MPQSSTSIFSEPEDFEAALRGDGVVGVLVMGDGKFRARLTQVVLEEICLRGSFQNSRASRPATRNMQALCSSDWIIKPCRS